MPDLDLLRRLGEEIAPPPFDALRECAQRRARRAAATTAVGAVAAVAVITSVTLWALPEEDTAVRPSEPPGESARPLTYALGATVHLGARAVTLHDAVVELDVTDDGAVVRTRDGALWFTDGRTVDRVGTLGEPGPAYAEQAHPYATTWGFVVSGNTGSRAGWLEFPQPGRPELVVFDQGTREVVPLDVRPDSYVLLESVTDRYASWFTSPEVNADDRSFPEARVALDTGVQERVTEQEYDAELPGIGTPRTITIGHDGEDDRTVPVVHDGIGWQLDVRGGRVVPQGAQPLDARDGATGARFAFAAPDGYPPVAPTWLSQWLDDDTVVITATRRGTDDLLECHVSTGACTVVRELPEAAVMPDIG